MRFKALPVTSLEDVTVNFEQLSARDILDQTGESVLQLALTGTKRKTTFGQTTLTWTASPLSGVVTVTHGLGITPVIVVATVNMTTTFLAYCGADTFTSTTFKLQGQAGSSVTVSASTSWIAIG